MTRGKGGTQPHRKTISLPITKQFEEAQKQQQQLKTEYSKEAVTEEEPGPSEERIAEAVQKEIEAGGWLFGEGDETSSKQSVMKNYVFDSPKSKIQPKALNVRKFGGSEIKLTKGLAANDFQKEKVVRQSKKGGVTSELPDSLVDSNEEQNTSDEMDERPIRRLILKNPAPQNAKPPPPPSKSLRPIAQQEVVAERKPTDPLSALHRDILQKNYTLKDPNEVKLSKKFVDVTAAVQANPDAYQSHTAYTNLFKVDASAEELGGLSFTGMSQVVDTHFFYWPDFKTVSSLDVSFCPNITDMGVRLIRDAFPKLKTLNVSGCRFVTENSLRLLSGQFFSLTMDMTSVRYVPIGASFSKLSVRGCPLLVQGPAKSASSVESLRPVFSFGKVIVIKTLGMQARPVANELLVADGEITGMTEFVSIYRSGLWRVIECVENSPIQLFLTNNCVVVLPFNGDNTDLLAEYKSVEMRFNFVSSLIVNFHAFAVPIFAKKEQAAAATLLNETDLGTLKNEQLKVAGSSSTPVNSTSKEKRQPESNSRVATCTYYLSSALMFLPSAGALRDVLPLNFPHADLPSNVFILFDQLAKSDLLNNAARPVIPINLLTRILPKDLHQELSPCWASFAEILAELGNCWMENFIVFDGPSHGPAHVLSNISTFAKFLHLFVSSKDATAATEDVRCLKAETPLCSRHRVEGFLAGLSDDDASRLLLEFEMAGLGLFNRTRTALAFANLPTEPHVPESHFKGKKSPKMDAHTFIYKLTCQPSAVFPRLVTTVSKILAPVVLWKSGAIFCEAACLDIWLICDEPARAIVLTVVIRKKIRSSVRGSFAAIHTVCSLVLKPFSTADFVDLGSNVGFEFVSPVPAAHELHKFTEDETVRTFTREFDPTLPRCSRCLLTDQTLAVMHRLHLASKPNAHDMIVQLPMDGKIQPLLEIALHPLMPTNSAEVLTVDSLKSCIISIKEFSQERMFIRVGFSLSNDIIQADFQVVKAVSSEETILQSYNAVPIGSGQLRIDTSLRGYVDGQFSVEVRVSVGGLQLMEANLTSAAVIENIKLLAEARDTDEGRSIPVFVLMRSDKSTSATKCPSTYSVKAGIMRNELQKVAESSLILDDCIRNGLVFVLLPSFLSWQSLCWPAQMNFASSESGLVPYFLCSWRPLMHFVNKPSLVVNFEKENISAFISCLAILRLMQQPHFIPDKFQGLFYDFPNAAGRNDVEEVFRTVFFPFLLDHLSSYANIERYAQVPKEDECRSVLNLYQGYLQLCGGPTKIDLVLMKEVGSEIYAIDEGCPTALCTLHAPHCIAYDKKMKINYETAVDFDESLAETSDYSSLLSTCVRTSENVLKPLSTTLPFISELYLGSCGLKAVPDDIFSLKFLSELVLRDNNINSLPDAFVSLAPTLQLLDLSLNKFTELPAIVFQLTELQSLRADFLSLTKLDDRIGDLKALALLSLRSNCLKTLPSTLAKLAQLQILDVSGLSLFGTMDYVEEAGTHLQKNRFPDEATLQVTNWIQSVLPTLTGSKRFNERSVELLNEHVFSTLQRLEVSGDGFPSVILSLTSLRELSLSYQPVTCVPEEIEKLPELRRLDLSGCLYLKSISPKIAQASLEMLALNNCPALSTPPIEIRKRGFHATTAYFRRLAMGSAVVQRTKLMFVGLGGAGKTSLVNALISTKNIGVKKGGDLLPVTDGIDITDWTMEAENGSKVNFKFWDFAGQVVYYNTHQFFLSNRAVYLIMWNIRLGHEHAGLDFWLSSIACHAPQASVIVVGTHADQVPEERAFLPEITYRDRFSAIAGFHYVSSHTGKGINQLRKHILEVALAQKYMGEAIPVAWLKFEEKLTQKKNEPKKEADDPKGTEASIVMLKEVRQFADSTGIYENEELDQALQFFTDLGSVQYFNTEFLCDRVIVNPQWIVDVMACIVSVKSSCINEGRLIHADTVKLWADYPSSLHPWLLKLTEAFDLTFPLRGEAVSVVPCMLPENPPVDFSWPNLEDHPENRQTELLMTFRYLPTGLFNRAQVRLSQLSDANMWRRGSLLRKNKHVALIMQRDATSVHVKVQGPRPENISFLILEVFDSLINESFHGIAPEYLFACPECVNVRAGELSMFERSRIRRASELHIPALQCYHYFHAIPTRELRQLLPAETAGDFDYQLSRTIQQLSGIAQSLKNDIVVIGSPADNSDVATFTNAGEIAKDLEKSLSGMKVMLVADPDTISFDQISVFMRSARLIVCCLSPTFMASDYCQAVLLCARETLRKPVLVILVREMNINADASLSYFIGDQVYMKAAPRAKYKSADVAEAAMRRINEAERLSSATRAKHPSVFISYCWTNSQDAIDKGTRPREGSVGVTDPRELKKYLVENANVECWLDIEQVGRNGLFEDIAVGLRHARVVVVCVSDEYVQSKNCLKEFRFAVGACQLPIIICVVGTGIEWKQSEVSLVVPPSAPVINFQINSKSNYDKLVDAVKECVQEQSKSTVKPSLGSIGRMKTMDDIKLVRQLTQMTAGNQEATATVFKEMQELEQRRFLRQIMEFTDPNESRRRFPRVVFIDVVGNQQVPIADSQPVSTPRPVSAKVSQEAPPDTEQVGAATVDIFSKLQWCARVMCETEDGWHPTDVNFALNSNDAGSLIYKSAGYLGRLFSLLHHSTSATTQISAPTNQELAPFCEKALQQIERLVKFEEPFESDYKALLEAIISLDQHGTAGGLEHCQLAIGKELWLCSQHQSSSQYRMKSKASNDHPSAGNEANELEKGMGHGTSYMVRHRPLKTTTVESQTQPSKSPESDDTQQSAPDTIVTKTSTTATTSRACLLQ